MNLELWTDRHALACHLLDTYSPTETWFMYNSNNCRRFLATYWKLCEWKNPINPARRT